MRSRLGEQILKIRVKLSLEVTARPHDPWRYSSRCRDWIMDRGRAFMVSKGYGTVLTRRKPKKSSRKSGERLRRRDDRQNMPRPCQQPPRITRSVSLSGPCGSITLPRG